MKLNLMIGLILIFILCVGVASYIAARITYDEIWQNTTGDKIREIKIDLQNLTDRVSELEVKLERRME